MIKKIFVFSLACISTLIAQHQHRGCQNQRNHSHHANPCSHSQIHKYQKLQSVQTASAPHAARMNMYDVKHYFLDIALERTSTYISGSVSILGQVTVSQLDTFSFQLHQNLTIDSVKINGIAVNVVRSQGEANALLSTSLSNGSLFEAKIWYKGTPPSGQSAAIGNGISNGTSQSWGNQITWTLSQPYAAYEWFPCKQILSDKADSVTVWVTTSTSNKVGSNGLLQQVTPMPNNKHRYEWKSHYPIDYYLISVTVGQYVEYNIYAKPQNYPDSILIQNYIYNNPNTLSYFQNEINKTKNLVELYSELYGLYPFHLEKYGHCMAPFSGGMEHQTMTSQGFFTYTLTAHELGHQWFGDYVTCDTWSDIWLNEGFASYSEYLALEYLPQLGNETAADWMNDVHDNVMSQTGGSVFVPDTSNVQRIFSSRLTYDKGAAILHTLRFVINNDSLFFHALRNYLQQHAFATATVQDFKNSVENTTNLNLQQFFQQWYYGEGYPTFNVRWVHLNNQLIMQVTQTTSTTVTPLFITPIEYKILRPTGGDTIIRLNHTQQVETYYIPLQGSVSNIVIDPSNWILNKGTVTQDQTLSLSTASRPQTWNIYPNPTQQSLHIQGTSNGSHTLTIYDTNGKLIFKQNFSGQKHTIDLSQWTNGTYILNIQNDEETFSTKFQKF